MTHLDLFSGIGGFVIAAQACGFTPVAFCEIEEYPSAVLRKHWPHVRNHWDIRFLIQSLEKFPTPEARHKFLTQSTHDTHSRISLLTGGPPCQPSSTAGKQLGAGDDRWLWPETLAVIGLVLPELILLENPTGFLSLNDGVEFDRVLSQMETLGYSTGAVVVPACAVDARHRRDRVWIMAHSNSAGRSQGHTPLPGGPSEQPDSNRLTHPNALSLQCQGSSEEPNPRNGQLPDQPGRMGRECSGCLWPPEPDVGRVAPGIPDRVERLKGLGNSIVPQVAQTLLKQMLTLSNHG